MLKTIIRFFEDEILEQTQDETTSEHGLRLATAALLIEMSRADLSAEETKRGAVVATVQRVYELDNQETLELVALAEQEAEQATSLYQFTSLINKEFSAEQKAQIVELLWGVALADGRIHKYEEHLVRRIADLIHVPHRTFIRAKHKVQAAQSDQSTKGDTGKGRGR